MQTQTFIWRKNQKLPKYIIPWVHDKGSLTKKLKHKYSSFTVQVLKQKLQLPHSNEILLIGADKIIVREVNLIANNNILIFARSLIISDNLEISNLGIKPLGEVIFSILQLKRGITETTYNNKVWGRRSLFTDKNNKILVCEFFMPILYER